MDEWGEWSIACTIEFFFSNCVLVYVNEYALRVKYLRRYKGQNIEECVVGGNVTYTNGGIYPSVDLFLSEMIYILDEVEQKVFMVWFIAVEDQ